MVTKNRCVMLFAILSAILYILSFPLTGHDVSLWPIIFCALAPFFICLDRQDSYRGTFLAGAVWGAVMSLGMAYWLFYAMIWQYGIPVVPTVIFMVLGLMLPHAVLCGLFAVMYRFLRENVPFTRSGLIFYCMMVPSLWVVMEFVREILPLMVPWGFAGYGLQPFNIYLQAADITGIYGISFLVVMINAIIALLAGDVILRYEGSVPLMRHLAGQMKCILTRKRPAAAVLLLVIILPVLYGAVRRGSINDAVVSGKAAGASMNVLAVQANFTQEERWLRTGFIERVNICLGLQERCGLEKAKGGREGGAPDSMIMWPETVLNAGAMVNSRLFSYIGSRIGPSRLLVAGGVRRTIGTRGVFNTAYLVHGENDVLFYDKNILLPYAETATFGKIFGDFYTAPAEFLEGRTPPAARTGAGVIGLSICFEALYPWYSRRSVREGARLLVNISNDGWFGRTSEPPLHLRQASVRSIESRRFMVRTSNNGYSAIISPTGEIVQKSGLFTRECLSGEAVLLDLHTIYSRFGDWIVYLAVGVIAVSLMAIVIKGTG